MEFQSRRSFLKAALRGGIGLAVLPGIIPARLLGADAPIRKIQVAQIGCGRMGTAMARRLVVAGNDVHVTLDGRQTNLHSAWDSGILGHMGKAAAEFLNVRRQVHLRFTMGDLRANWRKPRQS